jgi:hypothetical protein
MSKYTTVYTAVTTALGTITGVKSVTTEIGVFNKANAYPVLMVVGKIINSEYIMFPQATKEDREAEIEITVAGIVRPLYTKNIMSDTIALMASVEGKINGLTTAGIVSINLTQSDYDTDVNDKMGYFESVFNIKYVYNHLTP